jgi:acyl-CoA synthetase (NDP forming)
MNASGPSSVGLASVGLDRLLKPRSIAIVGVSREGAVAGKMGGSAVLDSLLRGGYRGSLHLVHPDAPQIDGRQSWPSVSALPETPDLVVASLPATRIPDLAAECGARGVGAMVIISAGFSELGTEQGRNLEDQLRRAANGAGVRLCGPNGLGFVNVSDGVFCGYFPCLSKTLPTAGGLSVITHSGAVGNSILARAIDRGVGIGHVISSGNETNVGLADYVDHLVDDARVSVISIYMEGASDGPALRRAFQRAADAGKPVVVYKIGRSEAGAAAALSHTAKVAGRHALYRGLFQQMGVIEASCLDDLIDIPTLFLKAGERGADTPLRRVAVVSISGGLGAIAAEHLALEGFTLPALADQTRARLSALPIAYGSLANPIDTTAAIHRAENSFGEVVRIVADDPGIDAVVVPNASRFPHAALNTATMLRDVGQDLAKPLLSLWYAGRDNEPAIDLLHRSAAVACYDDPGTCARALAALRDHRVFRATRSHAGAREAAPSDNATALRAAVRSGVLNEPEGKRLLKAWGVRVPREDWVHDADAAVAAAVGIGFPVALKIVSRDVLHKAEAGGVRLALRSEQEVRDAWHRTHADVATYAPGAKIDGALLSEMVPIAAELLVGFYRDETFGPALVVGLGGSMVEALNAVSTCPLPISRADCEQLIDGIPDRGVAIKVQPVRRALVDVIARVAAMATSAGPMLRELDINPLVITTGGDIVALDAVMSFDSAS